MTVAQITRYTPEDLLNMPDSGSMELVDGQMVEKQLSIESSEVEGNFHFAFRMFLLNHPIARAFPQSLGYQCFEDEPEKIRKPEVTVVRLDRLKTLENPNSGYMPIVPDLAVEVISPNDTVYEIDAKVQEYLDAGFPLVWVADPKARTIMVHSGKARPAIFTEGDEITAEELLPGFRYKVSDFFPPAPAKS